MSLDRLLEWRPALGLIGRQLESRLECGDPRVSKCGDVRRARSMMGFGAKTAAEPKIAETLLGIDIGSAGNSQQGRGGDDGLKHAILLGAQTREARLIARAGRRT